MTIASRWIKHMRWLSLLFMHWRVPVDVVRPMRPTIPTALTIGTFDGHAWVGLIPFAMREVRPTFTPSPPAVSHSHECDVRTYRATRSA